MITSRHVKMQTIALVFLMFFSVASFLPLSAQAQCGGGFGGWSSPDIVITGTFTNNGGVLEGEFDDIGYEGDWDPMTADMRYNTVDFLDPNTVLTLFLNLFSQPVAFAQCGGGPGNSTPAVSLTATPSTIMQGEESTLEWGSQNVTSCTSSDFETNGQIEGTAQVSPSVTTEYEIVCVRNAQEVTDTVTVTVESAPLSATCSPTPSAVGIGEEVVWSVDVSGGDASEETGVWTDDGSSFTKICSGNPGVYLYTCPSDFEEGEQCSPVGDRCRGGAQTYEVCDELLYGQVTMYSCNASDGGSESTYTYNWSGTDGLSGDEQFVQKTYNTSGSKTASVFVSSGSQSVNVACTLPVTVSELDTQCSDDADNDGDGNIDEGDAGCDGGDTDDDEGNDPTAVLSADPLQVVVGDSSTLTWDCSANTTSASINTSPVTTLSPANGNGTLSTGSLESQTNNFQLTCTNAHSSDMDTVSITTSNPTVELTAASTRVADGGSTTLSWDGDQVSACTLTGTNGLNYTGGVDATDVPSGKISTQTTFTVSCDGGVATDTVIVNTAVYIDEF